MILMIQGQTSFAQQVDQQNAVKCAKEVCMEPTVNEKLTLYCRKESNKDLEAAVDDWGPYLSQSESTCWCSCKYDVNHN